MKHLFVSFEIAKQLKDKGFDELCFTYWVNDNINNVFATEHNRSGWSMIGFKQSQMKAKIGICLAPTYQQVVNWFREKHDLNIYLIPSFSQLQWCIKIYNYMINYLKYKNIRILKSYEDVLSLVV